MTALLAFVDTETTGLNPDEHEVWEIAVIRRDPSGRDWESQYQIRKTEVHLGGAADPEALEINRYYERMIVPADCHYAQIDGDGKPCAMSRTTLGDDLSRLLSGAVLVGSNPGFDAAFLRVFLDAAPWHYRPVDVATLAAGHLYGSGRGDEVPVPYSSRDLSRAIGVEPPEGGVAHTALGDARWARDVFDAITTGGAR